MCSVHIILNFTLVIDCFPKGRQTMAIQIHVLLKYSVINTKQYIKFISMILWSTERKGLICKIKLEATAPTGGHIQHEVESWLVNFRRLFCIERTYKNLCMYLIFTILLFFLLIYNIISTYPTVVDFCEHLSKW